MNPPFNSKEHMLATLDLEYRRTASLTGLDHPDPRVRAAMGRVPREHFVPRHLIGQAYWDGALPIGHHQTISQPFIVALMTELVDPQPGSIVLEIGTGSGYQAAVLAELVERVYSVEIVAPLAREASERLGRLGYDNVEVKCADGYEGWQEHAPFDGIVVTAVAPHAPEPLIRQLAPGGRMVIPIGRDDFYQRLVLIEKTADGTTHQTAILPVTFVPLTGAHAS